MYPFTFFVVYAIIQTNTKGYKDTYIFVTFLLHFLGGVLFG